MTAMDEKSCKGCRHNDRDPMFEACRVSRNRTGDDLCIRLGGKVDRYKPRPSEVEKK